MAAFHLQSLRQFQELGAVRSTSLAWLNRDNFISYTCGFPGMTNRNGRCESHYILVSQVDDCLNYYLTMNVKVLSNQMSELANAFPAAAPNFPSKAQSHSRTR